MDHMRPTERNAKLRDHLLAVRWLVVTALVVTVGSAAVLRGCIMLADHVYHGVDVTLINSTNQELEGLQVLSGETTLAAVQSMPPGELTGVKVRVSSAEPAYLALRDAAGHRYPISIYYSGHLRGRIMVEVQEAAGGLLRGSVRYTTSDSADRQHLVGGMQLVDAVAQ